MQHVIASPVITNGCNKLKRAAYGGRSRTSSDIQVATSGRIATPPSMTRSLTPPPIAHNEVSALLKVHFEATGAAVKQKPALQQPNAASRRTESKCLSAALVIMLQEGALTWSRDNNKLWTTWGIFKRDFLKCFLPSRYFQNLEDEIRNPESQKSRERFKD
uniref:Retrotransposon gag domain-containing protein n=1 Tax=Glossina pallidipes TaxID=7398 RepID=A0A1B0AH84_GLOPL